MIYIDKHIEYLLLHNDCVIVPEFGAFIKIRYSASIDYEKGLIVPMSYEVRFNSAIVHDDGLLASSLARKLNVPFEEARNILIKEVEQLKSTLSEEGEIAFGRIGILKIDDEGNINFVPFSSPERTAKELGFVPVTISLTDKSSIILEKQIDSRLTDESEDLAEKTEHNRKLSPDYYYVAINKKLVKIAASLLILVMIAVYILIPGSEKPINEERASVVPVKTIDTSGIFSTRNSITGMKEQVSKKLSADETGSDKTDINSTAKETVAMTPEKTADYYLIVASFHTEKEADRFITGYEKGKYKLGKIKSKKLFLVTADSASAQAPLYHILQSQEFKNSFKEAWVWHK